MKEHPINEILKNSLQNINAITDVSKVIGNPIVLPNNQMAIPLVKVVCGFGVGGSEFVSKNQTNEELSEDIFPFGGGSGGAISLIPQALIVFSEGKYKLVSIEKENELPEKILSTIKEIVKK